MCGTWSLGSLGFHFQDPRVPFQPHLSCLGFWPLAWFMSACLHLLRKKAGTLTYLCVIESVRLQAWVPPDQLGRWHEVQKWVNGCSCKVESMNAIFWKHYNLYTLFSQKHQIIVCYQIMGSITPFLYSFFHSSSDSHQAMATYQEPAIKRWWLNFHQGS